MMGCRDWARPDGAAPGENVMHDAFGNSVNCSSPQLFALTTEQSTSIYTRFPVCLRLLRKRYYTIRSSA